MHKRVTLLPCQWKERVVDKDFYYYDRVGTEVRYNPRSTVKDIEDFENSNVWADLKHFLHKEMAIAQKTLESPQANILAVNFARGQVNECRLIEAQFITWIKAVLAKRGKKNES